MPCNRDNNVRPPALSEQTLDQNLLSALVAGNTLYVTMPAGALGAPEEGIAPIYYGEDCSAVALLPVGTKRTGMWQMGEDWLLHRLGKQA